MVGIGWLGVNKFRTEAANTPEVTLTNYSDLLDAIPYLIIYAVVRWVFERTFENAVLRRVKAYDPINWEHKRHKALKEGFCIFWYSFTVFLGLKYFAGTNLLPSCCFGTFSCKEFLSFWPLVPATNEIRRYFMIQLAYHAYTSISYEIQNRRARLPEYNEMMLHHCLAVALIVLCYLSSLFTFGITILLTSDFSDIFLDLTKFIRDTSVLVKYKVADYSFAIMVLSWLYLRGFVISGCLLFGSFVNFYGLIMKDPSYFNPVALAFVYKFKFYYIVKLSLISILIVLNLYWTMVMLKITYNRVVYKDTNFTNHEHGEKTLKYGQGGQSPNRAKEQANEPKVNNNAK